MSFFFPRHAPSTAIILPATILAILFVFALPPRYAASATRAWVCCSGLFNSTAHWSATIGGSGGASVPGVGDSVIFEPNASYDVTFSGNAASDEITVWSLSVTFKSDTSAARIYQVNTGEADLLVQSGATLNIGTANPDRPVRLQIGSRMEIGRNNDGRVVVSGNGSRLDASANNTSHDLGTLDAAGTLTYQNGAGGQIVGWLQVGSDASNATRGYLNVFSDADLTVGSLFVGLLGATGEVTVDGPGSTLVQTGTSSLYIGATSGGDSQLLIRDGGTFSTSTGLVTLNATGAINVDGGTLNLNGSISFNGGALNFLAGTINVPGSFIVGTDGPLGQNVTLASPHALNVPGTLIVDPFRTLTLDGGSLTTSSLDVDGTLDFHGGTLRITGAGGLTIGAGDPLGATVAIESDQRLVVTTTLNVDTSGRLLISGDGHVQAANLSNVGQIELGGAHAMLTASVTNLGLVHGHGEINGPLTNRSSGILRAGANQRLAFTSGFTDSNAGMINLQGGTVEFWGGLINDNVGRIVGRGTLITADFNLENRGEIALSSGISDIFGDVANAAGGRITISGNADVTFWDDVDNSGALFRVSAGSTATFFGELAGAGISGPGDVFIEADITPGFSPGTMAFGGSLSFGPLATLEIEIAGATPGAEFDQVTIANVVSLDGTLNATTINGFVATLPGQSFTIVTAGALTGAFDAVTGQPSPALPGIFWEVTYTPTSVILNTSALPGDIDLNGLVDRTDAARFSQFFGRETSSIWTTGDFNGDGKTTLDDWGLLQTHVGQSVAPSASTAAVPEPSAGVLFATLAAATFISARQTRHRGAARRN
jgi:T5SS/PEP-CTERM-associated repeat protein